MTVRRATDLDVRELPGLRITRHPATGAITVRSTIRYHAHRIGRSIVLTANRAGAISAATFPARSLRAVRHVVARAATGRQIKATLSRRPRRAVAVRSMGEYLLVVRHRSTRASLPVGASVHFHAIVTALDALD